MTLKLIAAVRNLCESTIMELYHLVALTWVSEFISF